MNANLKLLFDFQRFDPDQALQDLIYASQIRTSRGEFSLDAEESLSMVAGGVHAPGETEK